MRAPKLCCRCTKVATRGGYCDDHRPAPWTKGANARDRWLSQRPSDYGTLRSQCIRRDRGRCVRCGDRGTRVDHIRPVSEGGRWVLENLQLLCESCHQIKTREEARRGLRRAREG